MSVFTVERLKPGTWINIKIFFMLTRLEMIKCKLVVSQLTRQLLALSCKRKQIYYLLGSVDRMHLCELSQAQLRGWLI